MKKPSKSKKIEIDHDFIMSLASMVTKINADMEELKSAKPQQVEAQTQGGLREFMNNSQNGMNVTWKQGVVDRGGMSDMLLGKLMHVCKENGVQQIVFKYIP